ncbi:PIG-L deacetylase family protein [Mycobacterium paraterrae]|uniref:PIG-L family deacetylase n=1 Tax=Mycobacterium paraterrae TaxID=577492 RepID=A0ABY3VQB3_9MYCO|nr:PIG-L family deacetylase [Mycobacterium paraterrae]UMB71641.1 PIG-L family deacetylase [Mycobacterium paraterrae]
MNPSDEGSRTARFQTSPVAEGGTSVEAWTSWDDGLLTLDLRRCPGLTVVAPHPDDETLGLGATMAALSAAGVDVQVVSVTDGESAYPDSTPQQRKELKALRRKEVRRSARILGVAEPISLDFPDGELAGLEHDIATRLASLLGSHPAGRWCAATWRGDGHPDHETVGRAAAAAAARTGAELVEYPVWMWHWAQPGDPAVPWSRARRISLTDRAIQAKHAAVKCFPSQTRPTSDGYTVLPPTVVARALAVGEVMFI